MQGCQSPVSLIVEDSLVAVLAAVLGGSFCSVAWLPVHVPCSQPSAAALATSRSQHGNRAGSVVYAGNTR
jgi:hypothetical protein